MRIALIVVAAVAIVADGACGGGKPSASSTAGLEELHAASCSYELRCGISADMTTCLGALDAYDGQVAAAVRAGHLRIDAQALADCQAAYETAACSRTGQLSVDNGPCRKALVGTVGSKGSCQLDVECAAGLCALANCGSSCCKGTCGNADLSGWGKSTEGTSCFDTKECVPGLLCIAAPFGGQCAKPSARGGACSYSLPCDSFADVCDDASKTCVAGTPVSGQCKSSFECVTGSSCRRSAMCAPQLGVGAGACAEPLDCLPGLQCTVGYCQPTQVCPY